jgi:hypothetical protein
MKPAFYGSVISLGSHALQAAVDEDYETALSDVLAVIGEYQFNGLYLLLTALADWTVQAQAEAAGREAPEGGVRAAAPAWLDADTGKVTTDAAGVDDAARWAGQFLAARAAMDHDMTKALALALPPQCGRHVQVLVEPCAASVRALEGVS